MNPSILLFPDTEMGSSLDLEFEIINDTDGTITGNVVSESSTFSVVAGGGSYSLAAGEMLDVTVRYAPASHGTHTGIIRTGLPCVDVACAGTSVDTNESCYVYPLVILNFSERFTGTWEEKTFNIQNFGGGTLTGTVGSCSAPFQVVSGAGSYSLTQGQIHPVTVRFAPTTAGTYSCDLDTGTACTNVGCVGIGLAADQPICGLTPETLSFPDTEVGSTSDLSFTIRNVGSGQLTGTISESCAGYSVTSGAGSYSLGAGESRVVTVRFAPTAAGEATCAVTTGSDLCPYVDCDGTGTSGGAECEVNPTALDFPGTLLGELSYMTFTITNTGSTTLNGTVSESCEGFDISAGGGTYSLAPAASREVTIRFAPTEERGYACTINTGTSCPGLACAGTGVAVPSDDMVLVPAGAFTMGSDTDEGAPSEEPEHTPYLSTFYIDTYEVTNAKYADALNWAIAHDLITVSDESEPYGAVYNGPGSAAEPFLYMDAESNENNACRIVWDGSAFSVESGWENHPVVYVTWFGAAAYCNWRSGMNGRTVCYDTETWACDFDADGYRLPTEAEWEKAARGSEDERTYPWGEGIDCDRCNYSPDIDLCIYYTAAVDDPTYADDVSPYGAWQMAGNVWEWCNDWADGTYYEGSPENDPTGPSETGFRVSRGGSWWDGEYHSRCANREWGAPADFFDRIGFRAARRP